MASAVTKGGEGGIVGDDDYGLAIVLAQLEEKGVDVFLGAGVKVAGRFIGKEDGGALDDGAGNGYALLLTAGELRRLMSGTVRKAHGTKQFLCAGTGVAA